MADYTPIEDEELIPDAPIPSLLGFRWRDNPVAIAEGAAGAPRVEGRALDTHLGLFAGNGTNPAGIIVPDRCELIFAFGAAFPSFDPDWFYLRFTSDGGATWGGWQVVFSLISGVENIPGTPHILRLNLRTGEYAFVSDSNIPSGTLSVPSNCNGFQMRGDRAGDTWRYDCYCLGGLTA